MKLKSLMLAAALAACSGNPQPGDAGYSFNLNGDYAADVAASDGSSYVGTIQLETQAGGAVVGTMSLTSPMAIDGVVEGVIVGAEFSFDISYQIADAGCGGVAAGTGVIEEGGGGVSGAFDITDDCGGAPASATFTFTRP